MTRSIKQNRFCSRAAKRKSDMHSNDPTCADVYYALCTKNAKSGWNPGQMESAIGQNRFFRSLRNHRRSRKVLPAPLSFGFGRDLNLARVTVQPFTLRCSWISRALRAATAVHVCFCKIDLCIDVASLCSFLKRRHVCSVRWRNTRERKRQRSDNHQETNRQHLCVNNCVIFGPNLRNGRDSPAARILISKKLGNPSG